MKGWATEIDGACVLLQNLHIGNCGAVQAARVTLVGERNFLEVCAVAVRRGQVFAGSETQLCGLRPNWEPITFCGSHACLLGRRLSLGERLVLEPASPSQQGQ